MNAFPDTCHCLYVLTGCPKFLKYEDKAHQPDIYDILLNLLTFFRCDLGQRTAQPHEKWILSQYLDRKILNFFFFYPLTEGNLVQTNSQAATNTYSEEQLQSCIIRVQHLKNLS